MIWIIGGTKPSKEILKRILGEGLCPEKKICISVATHEGVELYSDFPDVIVQKGRMTFFAMCFFILKNRINILLDASHPYATEVSINAIKASSLCRIPYVRFERKDKDPSGLKFFDTITEIKDLLRTTTGTIFLTTGSRDLQEWMDFDIKRLLVRILPVESSIQKCRKVGLSYRQIIALAPPFSYELNQLLFSEHKVRYVVTKESGTEGGLDTKVQAAIDNNITVCCLRRPRVDYPLVETDETGVLEKLRELINR